MDILMMALVAAFICVGIALVVLLIELIKLVKMARVKVDDVMTKVDPMLDNARVMTDDLKPAVKKVDPLMDRTLLTLDAVNLEMMRVDEILEDVSQMTDAASNATVAVETITSAPVKAVSNVTTRVRSKLGPKDASEESTELDAKISEVAKALEDYKAAQAEAETEPNLEGLEKIVADTQPIEDLSEAVEQAAEQPTEAIEAPKAED